MVWARMLAYITGTVDQELLLRYEYLAAENRILKAQIKGRLLLSEADKAALAEIAHRLGRKALEEVAAAAMPDTILGWYRKLIANKFDGSRFRGSAGRPKVDEETEGLVVQMAKENPTWGYDRIVGALANLGQRLSDQTVGNILRRHGVPPAPKRKHTTSWKDFIRAHMDVLAGTDFFTVEVLTLKGLVTYYVLFFIQLESRRVCVAGITPLWSRNSSSRPRKGSLPDRRLMPLPAHSTSADHPVVPCDAQFRYPRSPLDSAVGTGAGSACPGDSAPRDNVPRIVAAVCLAAEARLPRFTLTLKPL
jgi:hypothetical protein